MNLSSKDAPKTMQCTSRFTSHFINTFVTQSVLIQDFISPIRFAFLSRLSESSHSEPGNFSAPWREENQVSGTNFLDFQTIASLEGFSLPWSGECWLWGIACNVRNMEMNTPKRDERQIKLAREGKTFLIKHFGLKSSKKQRNSSRGRWTKCFLFPYEILIALYLSIRENINRLKCILIMVCLLKCRAVPSHPRC